MTKHDFCYLYLTCENTTEATEIAEALLNKRLVVCAKQMPVSSDFHWQGTIEHGNEILLLMQSRLDLFEQVEAEVAKTHSYDTFVLEAVPISKISSDAEKWMKENLEND